MKSRGSIVCGDHIGYSSVLTAVPFIYFRVVSRLTRLDLVQCLHDHVQTDCAIVYPGSCLLTCCCCLVRSYSTRQKCPQHDFTIQNLQDLIARWNSEQFFLI